MHALTLSCQLNDIFQRRFIPTQIDAQSQLRTGLLTMQTYKGLISDLLLQLEIEKQQILFS